jgi:hypothetical protein
MKDQRNTEPISKIRQNGFILLFTPETVIILIWSFKKTIYPTSVTFHTVLDFD